MEDIHKESCINIHSNKGKHGYYLHFSGYESGELRQEEKQYEETAADRDWKRGKLRKRLVYISNKDTNCFHTGRSFPLQTCHPDTSNNQQFFCRDNTRPSKQWLQWHANTRRPAGYLNSWPTFSAMISISPQLLCSSPPTHCAGQPALPPLSQKCLSAVLLLEPLLHAEFYYTKTSLRRGKKKKKKRHFLASEAHNQLCCVLWIRKHFGSLSGSKAMHVLSHSLYYMWDRAGTAETVVIMD